jgi:hypothetical protein
VHAEELDDVRSIAATLKAAFDKSVTPLSVKPIVRGLWNCSLVTS